MTFGPFDIQEYHDNVRGRIEAGEPGYAQSFIGNVLVSYEAASYRGPVFAHGSLPLLTRFHTAHLIEELIVDVARQEGIASPRAFRRARIEGMLEERRGSLSEHPKMRRQSEYLFGFYLAPDAAGASLLF